MNIKIYNTKPTDNNRLEKEMDTYELLDKLNMPYTRADHKAANSVEDCPEIESALGVEICKNLFLRNGSKTEFYLLVMPGYKKFVTKWARTLVLPLMDEARTVNRANCRSGL
jgi:Ala-tRNA(Pro) deacylase